MKCPKKHVKEDFVMWELFHNLFEFQTLKYPKIEKFHFRFFFYCKIDHVLIFWIAPLFYVRIFPIWFWNREKWGISKKSNIKKWGNSKNWHLINFTIEKEARMKFFDFGAFQKIMKKLSHDKILFHMFLGHFMIPRVSGWNGTSI